MKKTKKTMPSVSVGIPAYNEENNIVQLLQKVLEQNSNNFVLKEIIVISDCSTDNTVKKVKAFKKNNIRLLENKERLGLALTQNRLLKEFKGDILIIFNADILPKDEHVISNLIQPILVDSKIGIVSGTMEPLTGKTFIERVLNYSIQFKRDLYEHIHSANNLYLCRGPIRAFSKSFAKQFKWEPTYGEDAYSYLACITMGYKFAYRPTAVVLFKSPDNLKDHLRQSTRFLVAGKRQKQYFPSALVNHEYSIPRRLLILLFLKYFVLNPYYFSSYILILIYAKVVSLLKVETSHIWNISVSSKKL